MEVNSSTLFIY